MVKDKQNLIYLDHASTTYIRDEVYEAMKPYLTNNFGNPSSIYTIAQQSRIAIDQSREKIAKILNCRPSEIIFIYFEIVVSLILVPPLTSKFFK